MYKINGLNISRNDDVGEYSIDKIGNSNVETSKVLVLYEIFKIDRL